MMGDHIPKFYPYRDSVIRPDSYEFGTVVADDESTDKITVAWVKSGKESVKEDSIQISDRIFKPGEIVMKSINLGFCQDVNTLASVNVIARIEVVSAIPLEELTPLQALENSLVWLNGNMGKVREVKVSLCLVTSDGSICDIAAHDCADDFNVNSTNFFVGQQLNGLFRPLYQKAAWEKKTKTLIGQARSCTLNKKEAIEATVQKITITSAVVAWETDQASESILVGPDLAELKVVSGAIDRSVVGERFYYTIREQDELISKGSWSRTAFANTRPDVDSAFPADEERQGTSPIGDSRNLKAGPPLATENPLALAMRKERELRAARAREAARARKPLPGSRLAVEVLSTASRATVAWQDGTVETGVATTELRPAPARDRRRLYPGRIVRGADGVVGVVQSCAGRIVVVRWFARGAGRRPPLSACEEVPAGDVEPIPESELAPGTVVVAEREGAGRSAGRVLYALPDGRVRVRWVDGKKTDRWPEDLVPSRFNDHVSEKDGAEVQNVIPPPPPGPLGESPTRSGAFSFAAEAPDSHRFKYSEFQRVGRHRFHKTVTEEISRLRTSLPDGVWVKGFEDRLDLFSVMIRGPRRTPYEDGLFLFDLQLSGDYPESPPLCRYVSYADEKFNPNLSVDGNVCLSLLGTWKGSGVEVWTERSNLLQLVVSIQGLVLVGEPYFNEDGVQKLKGTESGAERSREYNERAVLNTVKSLARTVRHPPPAFREEIALHSGESARGMCLRLEAWVLESERRGGSPGGHSSPDFPLIPASEAFWCDLRKSLQFFREGLISAGITPSPRHNHSSF